MSAPSMTPAAASALVAVFAAFVVGLLWRLVQGGFRQVWLLCLLVALFAAAALLAPAYRLWELAGCVAAVAALSVHSLVCGRTAVPARAPGLARDPDAVYVPSLPAPRRTPSHPRPRRGRAVLATLILLNVAIVGAALVRTAGWYAYGVSRSYAASERCLRDNGGGGTATAGAFAGYGPRVLAVRAHGGLNGSAVFLDSAVSARRFANDMAASTSLQAVQRGPIVLVTPHPVEGLELRRLGSCVRVVEVERLSGAFGRPFTRVRHPFGRARTGSRL